MSKSTSSPDPEQAKAREWLEAHYILVDGVNSIRGDNFCVGPVTLVDIDTLAPMLAAYAASRPEIERLVRAARHVNKHLNNQELTEALKPWEGK